MDERLKKAQEAIHKAQHDLQEADRMLHDAEDPSDSVEETVEAPVKPVSAPIKAPAPKPAAPPAPKPAPAKASSSWRVEFERDNCIGAGACVAANADYWSIEEDGKANLRSAVYDEKRKLWVLDIEDEAQLKKQRDAAGVCPVNVIHIVSPDGKREN